MKKAPGQTLLIGVIFMTVILILSASLFSRVASFLRFGNNDTMKKQAETLADAGIERTLWKLNTTAGACGDCTGEKTLGTTGTFEVTIVNKSSSLKTITSTGYVPSKANPRARRTVKTDAYISTETDVIVFNYAVQIGTGGINMSGGSIVNGNVYSNGNITGNGGATINGEAWAVGSISDPPPTANCSQAPCKHPLSPPSQMPIADPPTWYQQWRDAASAGGTNSNCNYNGGSRSLGPIKCSGDLSMSGGATVIVTGPIYVTGNITLSGGSILKLDDSFGSDETVIITDGTISLSGGSSMQSTNANPKGYILLTTTSTSTSALSISGGTQSSIFYALEGDASISGGVQLIALVAKTITMSGNSVLTYEQGLASSQFSGGPGGGWAIKKGTYRFTSSP